MADSGFNLNVEVRGAVLEGKAEPLVDVMIAGAVAEVADYAKFEVLMELHAVLQHPTGYYESQITDTMVSAFVHRIHDNGVIYGPWLEGVGSRNYPVTRFKGYHSFRVARNRLAQKSKAVVETHLRRNLWVL